MATQKHSVTTTPTGLIASLTLDATKTYSLQNRGIQPILLYEGAAAPAAVAATPSFILLPAPELLERSSTGAGFMEWTPEANEDLYVWTEQGTAILIVGLG